MKVTILLLALSFVFGNCESKKTDNTTRDLGVLAIIASQPTAYVGPGKLLFTDGRTTAKVFDLQTQKVETTLPYEDKGADLRVFAGGTNLFAAVALGAGTSTSEIRYLDLGIQSPNPVTARQIGGPTTGNNFGTHYRTDGIHHLNFYDGDGKTSLVLEDSLKAGQTTEITHTQSPHHGVAIGLDNSRILISRKHPTATSAYGASIFSRTSNSLTKEADTENCNNMHGEANNSTHVAFGCRQLDGVRDSGLLVVRKSDRTSSKVNYPTALATDFVSNIWAHNNQKFMIGNYGNKAAVLHFDPANVSSAREVTLGSEYSAGGSSRPVPVYEWARGNEIVFLLTNGNVAVHRTEDMALIRNVSTGLNSHIGVRMASGIGRVFLTSSANGTIYDVPLNGTDPVKTYNVGGAPNWIVHTNTAASGQALSRSAGSISNVGWVDTYDPWSELNE
jgi:hypothetical protein